MFVFLVIPEATGFQSCSDDFWAALVGAIRRHSVTFVGGDFNMSLLTVVFELRNHTWTPPSWARTCGWNITPAVAGRPTG